MQHSATNYDKVMKPVTRAADALKRDKQIKRDYPDVFKQLDKLESAADDVNGFKAVVDEKSFDKKLKLLQSLEDACANVVSTILNKSKKSGDKPVFDALMSALTDFRKQVLANLKEFESWFKKATSGKECEIKIPRDVTDMIELAQARGRITMPSDQSFDATVTLKFEGVAELGPLLDKNAREFIGEAGRALEPLKKETADAFKGWQSEYFDIEEEFDQKAAEKLFATINNWFDKKLPGLVQAALEEAMTKAVKDVCAQDSRIKDSWKKVDIKVACDFKNFAEFVFKIPENPADEATKAMVKDAESLIAAQKKYDEAIGEIKENYESLQKSSEKLQQGLQAAANKSGSKFEPDEQLKEMAGDTPEFETALKTAGAQSEAMKKFLDELKKKVDDPKVALKDNATIKSSDLGKLRTDLKTTLDQIGKEIPNQLKDLSSAVKASNDIQAAIKTLTDGGKGTPKPEDLKRASKSVEDARKAFKLKPSDVPAKLKLVTDGEKLKKLTESLKS